MTSQLDKTDSLGLAQELDRLLAECVTISRTRVRTRDNRGVGDIRSRLAMILVHLRHSQGADPENIRVVLFEHGPRGQLVFDTSDVGPLRLIFSWLWDRHGFKTKLVRDMEPGPEVVEPSFRAVLEGRCACAIVHDATGSELLQAFQMIAAVARPQ